MMLLLLMMVIGLTVILMISITGTSITRSRFEAGSLQSSKISREKLSGVTRVPLTPHFSSDLFERRFPFRVTSPILIESFSQIRETAHAFVNCSFTKSQFIKFHQAAI